MSLHVRPATLDDVSDIVKVDHAVWTTGRTSHDVIEQRIRNFSDGVPVCIHRDRIVGYGTMVRINQYPQPLTWDSVSHGGTINNHVVDGPILYGVSLTALPGVTRGIADAIFEYAFGLFETSSCTTFALGSRIPGYAKWLSKNPDLSAYVYVRKFRGSRPVDPELRLYHGLGFTIGAVLPNYFPDPDSLDNGVLVQMSK